MDGVDAAFEQAVDAWIRDAIAGKPPKSLDTLVCILPGVYPTDVRSAIERMERAKELDQTTARLLRGRAPNYGAIQVPATCLPVPHPLDFDWRFSAATVVRLVHECRRRLSGDNGAVLLGAPSVFWGLTVGQGTPALLLDANPAVIDALKVMCSREHRVRLCDFRFDPLPALQSRYVFIDPPWYPAYERLFLWAAARMCCLGGTVQMSRAPEGTRPGILAERHDALDWADHLGLEVENEEAMALGYVSPPFERNALRVTGLSGLPSEWRRSDLVTFRLKQVIRRSRPNPFVDVRWPEVSLGPMRVRVRPSAADVGVDPVLRTVVKGDLLDSVSSRDPRRGNVSVWTSGNRVYGTNSPTALLEVLRAIAVGSDPIEHVEKGVGGRVTPADKRRIGRVTEQVSNIAGIEKAELRALGWVV